MTQITVENLSFKSILKNISFQLNLGKTMAVVGNNGAGKTTLFHILLGFKFPSDGSFSIGNAKIGYVPERPHLNLDETFSSFLNYHAKLSGSSAGEIVSIADRMGLKDHLNDPLKNFSKGMLQKALIAQALIGKPEVLILDEPMSGLDHTTREEIKKLFQKLKLDGMTILFSSHESEDVELLADQVLKLSRGEVV